MGWDDAKVEATARALLGYRDRGEAVALPWPGAVPDLHTGYRVQEAADAIRIAERGDMAIGYKIAVTSAAARATLGVDAPFFGRLFRSITSASPAALPAGIGLWQVHEPEIALVIGSDLPPRGAPYDAETVRAATRAVLPCIEIVGTRFTPWTSAGAPNLAADNAAHGYWVIGPETADFQALDLMEAPITCSVGGVEVARGKGANVDGGPFAVTAWLANALIARGRHLRAGDYVTTGTATAPVPVKPGQHVTADFGALGAVSVTIAS